MEILERCLDAKDPAKVLLAEPSLITDDFSLGLISSFYLTNPKFGERRIIYLYPSKAGPGQKGSHPSDFPGNPDQAPAHQQQARDDRPDLRESFSPPPRTQQSRSRPQTRFLVRRPPGASVLRNRPKNSSTPHHLSKIPAPLQGIHGDRTHAPRH